MKNALTHIFPRPFKPTLTYYLVATSVEVQKTTQIYDFYNQAISYCRFKLVLTGLNLKVWMMTPVWNSVYEMEVGVAEWCLKVARLSSKN